MDKVRETDPGSWRQRRPVDDGNLESGGARPLEPSGWRDSFLVPNCLWLPKHLMINIVAVGRGEEVIVPHSRAL